MGPARLHQLAEVYNKINMFSAYREAIPKTVDKAGDMGVQIPDTQTLTIEEMDEVSALLRQHLIEQQGVIVSRKLEELHAERIKLEALLIDNTFLKQSILDSFRFNELIKGRESERAANSVKFDTKWVPHRPSADAPAPSSVWRRMAFDEKTAALNVDAVSDETPAKKG